MKKLIWMAVAAVAMCAALHAGQDNLLMKFSTPGPDTYADGKTQVADGEFYALVWVKKGTAFAGFLADGRVVDAANSALICAVPYAENGHCPETVVEIDPRYARRRGQAEGQDLRRRERIRRGGEVQRGREHSRRHPGRHSQDCGACGDGLRAAGVHPAAADHVHQGR